MLDLHWVKIMEFTYSLPEKQEVQIPTQSIIEALGKNSIGTTQAENLLCEPESPEIRNLRNAIESQAETSLSAATTTIHHLNALRLLHDRLKIPTSQEVADVLDVKIDRWQKDGSLDWCNEYIEQNGGDITLVTTPNILIASEELISLARNFGQTETPPTETYVYEEFWERFSPQELSGPQSSKIISGITPRFRFSLIPSAMGADLRGAPEQQKQKFQTIQSTQPNIQVPSPLDAVSSWYALRAKGSLNDEIYYKTCVCHFDIEPKTVGGWSVAVPHTFVSNHGGPHFDCSSVERGGRVAVG